MKQKSTLLHKMNIKQISSYKQTYNKHRANIMQTKNKQKTNKYQTIIKKILNKYQRIHTKSHKLK